MKSDSSFHSAFLCSKSSYDPCFLRRPQASLLGGQPAGQSAGGAVYLVSLLEGSVCLGSLLELSVCWSVCWVDAFNWKTSKWGRLLVEAAKTASREVCRQSVARSSWGTSSQHTGLLGLYGLHAEGLPPF
jgi:hypothetical protein